MGAPAKDGKDLLRRLPPVNDVVASLGPGDLAYAPREEWVEETRLALAELRAKVLSGGVGPVGLEKATAPAALLAAAKRRMARRRDPGLVRVVNATGVVLHTNLGRAALPPAALEAIAAQGRGYQLLAADRETGERAPRERHIEAILRRLTGAEAATVVTNNAAATMIVLSAMARGKEVVVSRGQLVEIGGAYRIPEVMAQSGAVLREVGTTNRTHLADYERAIGPETGLLLRVHTSNYRVVGFQGEVPLEDLVRLGKVHGVPVADDLGSGALVPLEAQGLPPEEPLIRDSVAAGVDLVTASGDKLIGGPQMGIVLGKADAVARVRAHPLYRAVRCDKLVLLAMEATLRLFLHPERLRETHPTWSALTATREDLRTAARSLAEAIDRLALPLRAEVVDAADAVGAGSLPTVELPGAAVRLVAKGQEAGAFAQRLRAAPTPVFTTVHDDAVHLHVRTLQPGDERDVVVALRAATA
jgi:L-seryl-tRNA(Ser) seleniumtransferase